MRDDDNMQLTEKEERRNADRRLCKKHIQGFIVGILVATIFFMIGRIGNSTGSLAGVPVDNSQTDDLVMLSYISDGETDISDNEVDNSDGETDISVNEIDVSDNEADINDGETDISDNEVDISDNEANMSNLNQELYEGLFKSAKPVIIYYTNDNFDENNEYVKVIRKVIGDCEIIKGEKIHEEARDYFEVFYEGNKITRHTITTPVEVFSYWLRSVNEQWEEKPVPTLKPEPTPLPTPTFYKVFPADIKGDFGSYSGFDVDYTCELKLTTYGFASKGNIECKDGVKLNVNNYMGIYALLENKYGGDSSWFGIPDLSVKIPLNGLKYEMIPFGSFLDRSEEKTIAGTDGLNYLATEIEPYENIIIGQILLAKDIDETKYAQFLQPCDGREIATKSYFPLYTLIGDKFGSAGANNLKLPDLSGLSPIEGAKYYIVTNGRYPERN